MSDIIRVTLGMTNNFLKNRRSNNHIIIPKSPIVGKLLTFNEVKNGVLNRNYHRNLISDVGKTKKGFFGFFNAPVDPFKVKRPYEDDLIRISPDGQVRLNPGIPLFNPDYYGSSSFPFQPHKPPYLSMDYLIHKLYNTAFILQNVKNVTPKIKEKYQNELDLLTRGLQKMYPFDYKGIPSIQRSINNVFSNKVSSGQRLSDNIFDVIREADRYRGVYMSQSPFQQKPYNW